MDIDEAFATLTAAVIKLTLEKDHIQVGDHAAVLTVHFVFKGDTTEQAEASANAMFDTLRAEHPGDAIQVQATANVHTVEVVDGGKVSNSPSSSDAEEEVMARVISAMSGPLDRILSGVNVPSIEEYFSQLRSYVLED